MMHHCFSVLLSFYSTNQIKPNYITLNLINTFKDKDSLIIVNVFILNNKQKINKLAYKQNVDIFFSMSVCPSG